MPEKAWRSDKQFLSAVAALPCLASDSTGLIKGFANDAEVLYATLFSIIESSNIHGHVRKNVDLELKKFAENAQITMGRQRDLCRKVQIAHWNALVTIREYGIESFIDDFVAVCMQDKKIELWEDKLIVRICNYIDSNTRLEPWQSDKKFLRMAASLPCFSDPKTSWIRDFANDAEILYATMYAIIRSGKISAHEQKKAKAELKKYAVSAKIATGRQDVLCEKVDGPRDRRRKADAVRWNAPDTIRQYGIDVFFDDFFAVFLADRKHVHKWECRLLDRICRCLDLNKEQKARIEGRLEKYRQVRPSPIGEWWKKIWGKRKKISGKTSVSEESESSEKKSAVSEVKSADRRKPSYNYLKNYMDKRSSKIQYRVIRFFQRPSVFWIITGLIILNAIQLGLAVCPWFTPYKGKWFDILDWSFIGIFSVEILCKIFAFRKDFFREPQNVFDFIVVAISLIPSPVLRWASALRIFRATLLLNRLSQLKSVMNSLRDALPSIGWVSVLLLIVYYVFAVLTTNLFRYEFAAFQSIGSSFSSLFQLMTLESWPELLGPVVEKHPYSWLIFIPFIVLTSYIFLNLVTSIIVTSMHDLNLQKESSEKRLVDEIWDLRDQVSDLSAQIDGMRELMEQKKDERK